MTDKYLVQRKIDGELHPILFTASELVRYISLGDCYDEDYEIFDCTSEYGVVKKLYYAGWKPGNLIEILDDHGNVVVKGYGINH